MVRLVRSLADRTFQPRCGVRLGDTILAVNGEEVVQVEEAIRLLKEAPVGKITLKIERGREAAAGSLPQVEAGDFRSMVDRGVR